MKSKIAIKPNLDNEAKSFILFLQTIGKRYDVHIAYRSIKLGELWIKINNTSGNSLSAFLQDLVLNKGVYYYCCTRKAKHKIINSVLIPIFQRFLEEIFDNPQTRSLKKHILGKISDPFMPGDCHSDLAHSYEILFRKWDSKLIGTYDFIEDLDSLLTRFMLEQLKYPKGTKSPKFQLLVNNSLKVFIIQDKETKNAFTRVHTIRTNGLHRQERDIKREDVSQLAVLLYIFFKAYDDLQEAQKEKTVRLNNKIFRRVKYGFELPLEYIDNDGKVHVWKDVAKRYPCHDCGAVYGQYHSSGCDVEQCPSCNGQALGCDCEYDYDY